MPTKLSAKFKSVIVILLIIILGATLYFNSLSGEFIWDDYRLIKNNLFIRSWSGLSQVFSKNICAGSGEGSNFYRPLQMVSYIGDYSLWKFDLAGYHLTNILLHILAALALYFFIRRLFNHRLLALFSTLLFITHPVHTEAVAYLSGRADPLVTIFILLSFIFYLKLLQTKQSALRVMLLLSFVLALLSRENALILPGLLLLYHYTFKQEFKFKPFLSVLSLAGVYIAFRLIFMKSVLYQEPVETTLMQRLPGFFAAVTNYIGILFLPVNLHMEYGNLMFSFLAPEVILGLVMILLLLILAFKTRNSYPLVCFCVLWFIITLLPVANLYPVNAYMAEHWLYLPSIGFFIILGQLFVFIYERKNFKFMALGLLLCLLGSYSYLTIKQNDYWRSGISFFKRTLEYSPWSYRAYDNLGNIFCAAGDNAQGLAMYAQAIQINPRYAQAYNNMGNTYIALGRNEEGIRYCLMALDLNKYLPQAYYNLGNAYYNLGQKEKSIEMLEKSVKLDPLNLEACNNLAAQYVETGNIDAAIGLWEKCVKLSPDFMAAHFNLAIFYFTRQDYALALKHCDRVIALGGQVDPKFLAKLAPFRNKKIDESKIRHAIINNQITAVLTGAKKSSSAKER